MTKNSKRQETEKGIIRESLMFKNWLFFKIKFRNIFALVWECKLRLLVPEFIKEERAEV